jgi:hypothetical protein
LKTSKENRHLIFQQPLHQQYKVVHKTIDGVVLQHILVNEDESDFETLLLVSKILLKQF